MGLTGNPGRIAGFLYLLMIVFGAFSLYIPSTLIVSGDATATAANILASEKLYRLTIVCGLLSAVVFVFLARALYDLLDHVSHMHSSLMVTLVTISVAIGFAVTVNDLAVLVALRDVGAGFNEVQRHAIAMTFVRISAEGALVAQIFWGLWLFPFGVLVMRSGFLPRVLGVLLILNGVALLVASLTGLLLPTYASVVNMFALIPELGEMWMMLWLLIKGAKPQAVAQTAA